MVDQPNAKITITNKEKTKTYTLTLNKPTLEQINIGEKIIIETLGGILLNSEFISFIFMLLLIIPISLQN